MRLNRLPSESPKSWHFHQSQRNRYTKSQWRGRWFRSMNTKGRAEQRQFMATRKHNLLLLAPEPADCIFCVSPLPFCLSDNDQPKKTIHHWDPTKLRDVIISRERKPRTLWSTDVPLPSSSSRLSGPHDDVLGYYFWPSRLSLCWLCIKLYFEHYEIKWLPTFFCLFCTRNAWSKAWLMKRSARSMHLQ